MKTLTILFFLIISPLLALAEEYHAGSLAITDIWARPTMGEMKNTAVYLTIKNTGTATDVLTAVSTPAAEESMIHNTLKKDGKMKMLMMDNVALPIGEEVKFTPGGLHIMLIDVKHPLSEGDKLPLTLTFRNQGKLDVQAEVKQQ